MKVESVAQQRANPGLHDQVIGAIGTMRLPTTACIVDIGCGSGAMLMSLAQAGFRKLYGVDIKPPASSPHITYLQGDLDDCHITLESDSVDVVLAVEVFEHVENMGSLLSEISRVLKPEGYLLVTTPNVMSIEARLRLLLLGHLKQFDHLGDPTHIYPIFLVPFSKVLFRHGLQIVHQERFPLDGSSPSSRLPLRWLASLLRLFGLKGLPDGDNLYLQIVKLPTNAINKQSLVTKHYSNS